jgi:acyl-CoA synthetase (AMP-forming)/AMP-acid ligase II
MSMRDTYETTLGECLRARAAAFPDRIAIEMIGEGRETFSECLAASLRFAQSLIAAGIRPGDTVIIMATNCLTAIHAWIGANLAGATEVTINTDYRARLLEHAVNTAGARLVIAEAGFLQVFRESEAQLPQLDHILHFRALGEGTSAAAPAFERIALSSLEDVLAAGPDVELPVVRSSDIASVIYTSGTTGPAKGVMMPHAQVCALARQSIEGLRLGADDVFYCFHPLFHMAGKFMAAAATHPAVAESAAVGVPSEFESDDDIKLCLVAKPAMQFGPEEIIRHLAGVLPHYMVPRYVETLPALPRTPTNKVRKAELRADGVSRHTWDRKAAGIVLKDVVASIRSSAVDRCGGRSAP